MNTVRSDKMVYPNFNKTNLLKENKKVLILVLSENQYLLGIFQGYCHVAGCKMKTLALNNNADFFFQTLKKESPSVVFIDMAPARGIINSPEWATTWLSIQENKIALCGIGKQPTNKDETLPQPVFNKIFTEPLNIEEIQLYLDDKMAANALANNERRANERRRGDRRNNVLSIKYETSTVSHSKKLDNEYTPDNPPDSGQSRRIGPLVIDYRAKIISVNGAPIEISPKKFDFISLLAQQPGCVFNINDILKKVWPENMKATHADVHQYVYVLRHKLEENPHKPKLLLTVKGFGYRLCP